MFQRATLRHTTAVIAAGLSSSCRWMVRLSVNGKAPPGASLS
jgi:hypothetical protein